MSADRPGRWVSGSRASAAPSSVGPSRERKVSIGPGGSGTGRCPGAAFGSSGSCSGSGRHSSVSRRRHTCRRARISSTCCTAATAFIAGTLGLCVSAWRSALVPEKRRSVPIGPIRDSRPSLIHCWESSSAMARVACRLSAGTGRVLATAATPTAAVSMAAVTTAARNGSRSAGWSSRCGNTCFPPRACSTAVTTPTTSSAVSRRSSKATRTRPTTSFTVAHSTPSSRSRWRRSARRTSGRPSAGGAAISTWT